MDRIAELSLRIALHGGHEFYREMPDGRGSWTVEPRSILEPGIAMRLLKALLAGEWEVEFSGVNLSVWHGMTFHSVPLGGEPEVALAEVYARAFNLPATPRED